MPRVPYGRRRAIALGLAGVVAAPNVVRAQLRWKPDRPITVYNPLAAVPSLHFGYALIVGGVLFAYSRRRWVRVLGAAYPAFMLFDIVATGNHFFFDAAVGTWGVSPSGSASSASARRSAPARRRFSRWS